MDIQNIAAGSIALLVPFLGKMGESLAEKAGEGLFEQAKLLFESIKNKLKGDQTAEEALKRLIDEPQSPVWRDMFRGVLIMTMEKDPDFAMRIENILVSAKQFPSSDTIFQNIDVSGEVGGSLYQIGKMEGNISDQ